MLLPESSSNAVLLHPDTMAAPSETKLDWAAHRTIIEDLYWVQAKELPEVMKIMEAVYAFTATHASLPRSFPRSPG